MAETPASPAAGIATFLLAAMFGASTAVSAQPVPTTLSPSSANNEIARMQPVAKPLWSELSPAQKEALAPLEREWDALDEFRKNKWLVIGNRYSSMKPYEQQRVQERMRDWARLTPEQRRIARENYIRARKLKSGQKSAQWEQYQQLPDEEKRKLASEAGTRKSVTTLPPPAQRKDNKTIPPIKATPKPLLEQSVTPHAASQSALQPALPPDSK